MVDKRAYNELTWIDASSPTPAEVRELIETYKLHPLVGEELLVKSSKPKVDLYKDYVYLILHFPAFGKHGATSGAEIDFVIGKDFLITTRYENLDPLRNFSKIFEMGSILDRADMGRHAGYIFFYMMKHLYGDLLHELESVEHKLVSIEKNIFEGNEREMVGRLSVVGRELLNFKRATRLHRSVLESLEVAGERLFDKEFSYHLKTISGICSRVSESLESNLDFLSELRATNDSLLESKQNEVILRLTLISFAILPLSLFASLFSMNLRGIPFMSAENGFSIAVLAMLSILAATIGYFKVKRWF